MAQMHPETNYDFLSPIKNHKYLLFYFAMNRDYIKASFGQCMIEKQTTICTLTYPLNIFNVHLSRDRVATIV